MSAAYPATTAPRQPPFGQIEAEESPLGDRPAENEVVDMLEVAVDLELEIEELGEERCDFRIARPASGEVPPQ